MPDHIVLRIRVDGDYFAELDARMKRLGITRNMLAEALDVDKSQVSRWFANGSELVHLKTVRNIERAILTLRRRAKTTQSA